MGLKNGLHGQVAIAGNLGPLMTLQFRAPDLNMKQVLFWKAQYLHTPSNLLHSSWHLSLSDTGFDGICTFSPERS